MDWGYRRIYLKRCRRKERLSRDRVYCSVEKRDRATHRQKDLESWRLTPENGVLS